VVECGPVHVRAFAQQVCEGLSTQMNVCVTMFETFGAEPNMLERRPENERGSNSHF
jgi:hypothetical protein